MADIFSLSDDAVDTVAESDPMLATFQGIAGYDHRWTDLSPEGAEANRDLHASIREAALACDVPDRRHLLAQQVLVEHCDAMTSFVDMGAHQRDLNNIASPHQSMRFIYGSQAGETADDWVAIIQRLETVGEPLAGWQASLEQGRQLGNVASRRQVEAILEQGEAAIGPDSSFDSVRERLAASPVESDPVSKRLDEAIVRAKRAFSDCNDYLRSTYLPAAALNDAVGEDFYVFSAERFLGTRLDPHETYAWGWSEVERLWRDMEAACAELMPGTPVAQVLEELQTSPAYAAGSIDEFVELMQARQEQALVTLEGEHFDVPTEIRAIDIQVEPAGGAMAPYYVGPSEDFRRAGSVWYPIEGNDDFPLFAAVTTAYHEGFPGHHLQVGVQAALRDELSRFHRMMVWYPGSGEGWALYAEQLMGELGYLERPEYRIGLLTSQLLRAARVAIDIGVHLELAIPNDVSFHPGDQWSFETAYELLATRTSLSAAESQSEVLRYFGWPGQAISYKVGEQAILDLRDVWRQRGDFDPKAFHAKVLGVGSIGLDLMREHVLA